MRAVANPFPIDFQGDAGLGALLSALEPHGLKPLVLEYAERTIQPGYHVTEVKAGSFVTLDCGGNPDQWQETILQVEDLPSQNGRDYMLAGKFKAILDRVAESIALAADARLTFEVGRPGEPMRIFDVSAVQPESDRVILQLTARPAICKPRHRAVRAAADAECCGASPSKPTCC